MNFEDAPEPIDALINLDGEDGEQSLGSDGPAADPQLPPGE